MALTDVDRGRTKPLEANTVDRLAREYRDMSAQFQITWDDRLVLRVNREQPIDLGQHEHFRTAKINVPLKKGPNQVLLLLSNEQGSNHGGWTFAFKATAPDGTVLVPRAVD